MFCSARICWNRLPDEEHLKAKGSLNRSAGCQNADGSSDYIGSQQISPAILPRHTGCFQKAAAANSKTNQVGMNGTEELQAASTLLLGITVRLLIR